MGKSQIYGKNIFTSKEETVEIYTFRSDGEVNTEIICGDNRNTVPLRSPSAEEKLLRDYKAFLIEHLNNVNYILENLYGHKDGITFEDFASVIIYKVLHNWSPPYIIENLCK